MDFLALSLPEAAYLYYGLALQALVRASSMRLLHQYCRGDDTVPLVPGAIRGQRGWMAMVVGYVCVSTVLLVLFWPEAIRLAGRSGETEPDRVASYAAMRDPGAVVITARDTGLLPEGFQAPALFPTGFRLLLQAFTQTHLALARALNSQSHRTFAPVVPMQWLLTHTLSGDAQAAVRDWVHGCYLPAKTRLLQRADGLGLQLTFQDFLPWGGSQLQQELPLLEVTPGQQSGLVALLQRFLGIGGRSQRPHTAAPPQHVKEASSIVQLHTQGACPHQSRQARPYGQSLPLLLQLSGVLFTTVVLVSDTVVPAAV